MDIKEMIKLKLGTKVYRVWNGELRQFRLLGFHPQYPETYVYLVNGDCVTECIGIYIPNDRYFWTDNYHDAKEELWKQSREKIDSINKIFFEGKKEL